MYVDLYLKDTHEKFKAFDPDTEFGCLKLGVLKFYDVRDLEGLDQKQVLPKWNERLSEYEDVEEINAMDLLRNYMFIETDTKTVRFSFRDFDIEILN